MTDYDYLCWICGRMVSPEDMEWGTPHCKTHTSGEVGIWISTEEEPPEMWRNEIEEDDGWGDIFK